MKEYKSGVLPSPLDVRDWHIDRCMDIPAGGASAILPNSYSVPYIPRHKNQSNVNSCTAFAMAAVFECIWYKLKEYCTTFSTGYLYGNRLESVYHGEGCIMRDVVKTAQKHGDVMAKVFDNNLEVPEAINEFLEAFPEIKDNAHKLVAGYVRIQNADEARAFLVKYEIPLFASVSMRHINPLIKSDALHALIVTGYKNSKVTGGYFKCQNSWGEYNCPRPEIEFEEFKEVWGIVPMTEKKFTDVAADRWSAEAIQTAANDGIIEGFPDNTFQPETPLTREQMSVVWQRMKRYFDDNYAKNL